MLGRVIRSPVSREKTAFSGFSSGRLACSHTAASHEISTLFHINQLLPFMEARACPPASTLSAALEGTCVVGMAKPGIGLARMRQIKIPSRPGFTFQPQPGTRHAKEPHLPMLARTSQPCITWDDMRHAVWIRCHQTRNAMPRELLRPSPVRAQYKLGAQDVVSLCW